MDAEAAQTTGAGASSLSLDSSGEQHGNLRDLESQLQQLEVEEGKLQNDYDLELDLTKKAEIEVNLKAKTEDINTLQAKIDQARAPPKCTKTTRDQFD